MPIEVMKRFEIEFRVIGDDDREVYAVGRRINRVQIVRAREPLQVLRLATDEELRRMFEWLIQMGLMEGE